MARCFRRNVCLPCLLLKGEVCVFFVWILFCYVLLVVSLFVSPFVCCFLFLGDFLQNSQHETKIVKKTVTKTFKIDTNRGHTGKSMPRNVITLGSPKGLDRCDRVVFFLLCQFCQLLLRDQGFSLQSWHLAFLQIYFHQIILSLFDEPNQPNSPTFPAPTHNKKNICCHTTFIRVTHTHESCNHEILSISIFPTHQKTSNHSRVFQPHKIVQGIWCQRLWVWVCLQPLKNWIPSDSLFRARFWIEGNVLQGSVMSCYAKSTVSS